MVGRGSATLFQQESSINQPRALRQFLCLAAMRNAALF
jgi:hypothetical protein